MTPREAAKTIGVSYQTVMKLIKHRAIGHLKIGKRYVIPDRELHAFLDRALVPSIADHPIADHPDTGGQE